jgi:4-amino-4-deoxy-L-arabinose transferase-like glycosyltransferase
LLPALVTRGSIVIVDTPAAFWTTTAILFAAQLRESRRAMRTAVASGAAAGLAFTSKYPAGLCIIVLLAVLVLDRNRPGSRRAVLAFYAIASAVVAAIATMPALVLRPNAVIHDLRYDSQKYRETPSKIAYLQSLTSSREVGWLIVILAIVGIVVLARSPRSRSVVVGFLVMTTIFCVYFGRYRFQPFRSFLPLLPFTCVAAAIALVTVAEAANRYLGNRRAVAVGLLAGATLVTSAVLATGLRTHFRLRTDLIDSRVHARQWLERHTSPDDRVLIASQVAFLPSELRRIHAHVITMSTSEPLTSSERDGFRYIVIGSGTPGRDWIAPRSSLVAHYGTTPTPTGNGAWRGNSTQVRIFG